MKTAFNILLFVLVVTIAGCNEQQENPRVHLREEVGSDTLGSNIVTRPVVHAFSALIGEGLEITEAVTRRNDAGILELYINGHNRSFKTRRFKYRVEWLDESGFIIPNKTSVWLPGSAMGKSPFSLKISAPRPDAADFRMDTKKWE